MLTSAVQRERLVSPLGLSSMVVVFGVAFYFLVPRSDLAGKSTSDASQVDDLQLAYLKAQKFTGKASDADVIKVIQAFASTGQAEQAYSLLLDYPDVRISDSLRFEIDMELASKESDVSLYGALQTLLATPELQRVDLLEHAAKLGEQLQHPQLSINIYDAWVRALKMANSSTASRLAHQVMQVYQRCGEQMLTIDEARLAATCYQKALESAPDTSSVLDIQLSLLPLLDAGGTDQQALAQSLMQETDADQKQLQRLASAFLASRRPDLAYRIYARLALRDSGNAGRWLQEAARWAEASGKLKDAVVFLEAVRPSKDSQNNDKLNDKIESLLLQAGQTKAALDLFEKRLDQTPENAQLLERGIDVAMQAGNPQQALAWNTTLVSMEPQNIERLKRQTQLAWASGDLHQAKIWAERWLTLDASDRKARQRLAQLSEWDGDLPSALENWLFLAKEETGASVTERIHALREVVRISELDYQPGVAADALHTVTLLAPAPEKDIAHLVSLYEIAGQPEQASAALHDIIALQGPTAFVLRTLAQHEYVNFNYAASLAAWDLYVEKFGHEVEATLARAELLWRLDLKEEATRVAGNLQGQTLIARASEYQVRVLAEIAWRHRYYWLDVLLQPRIASLQDSEQRALYERRRLTALRETGKDQLAMNEALKLWGQTGDKQFGLLALSLAVKVDAEPVIDKFSPGQPAAQSLQKSTAYWNQLGSLKLQKDDAAGAREAYQRALTIDPEQIDSIAALLWLAVGEEDEAFLQTSLTQYSAFAEDIPELWQVMAVGYLQLGAASKSLMWFDKFLDQINSDYGMLLTYADALEYAGSSGDARKVRSYALQKLRPLLVEGAGDEQAMLLRQFASLSGRYEGVEFNESLIDYLLKPELGVANADDTVDSKDDVDLWREDFAISFLMSTQQYDHARLIMARIHAKRLQAPAWQQVAIALRDKDDAALRSIVDSTGPLSVGNHILALRQLGHDTEAYALAQQALVPGAQFPGSVASDRTVALEQYVSLRNSRPDYVSATFDGNSLSGLDRMDQGVEFRHSLANSRFGFAVEAFQRRLESDRFLLEGAESQINLSASVFFTDTFHGGELTAGISTSEQGNLTYITGDYSIRNRDGRRELSAEIAYNEAIDYSPELTIAGAQNRVSLGLDAAIGRQQFIRLSADATQINTRIEQQQVATGLSGLVEAGVRGTFGSNNWSTSITASQQNFDRVSVLPEELRLSLGSTVNSVLVENVQRLSIGASLSRGGVNADFPQVTSPRYYFNSNVGQNWPEQVISFQIDAGAGFRVLGGDELSFSLSHETQPITRSSDSATSFGLQYRYHFQ